MTLTTYAHADLTLILAAHRKWVYGQSGGARAVLTRAVLRGAVLRDADLRGAVLTRADLTGADLRGAVLTGAVLRGAVLRDARLSDGVLWGEYLSDLVPALLVAGGRRIDEVANPRVWNCHSWQNCPMAEAFGVHELAGIPPLYRGQAERFVQLFDAQLIALADIPGARMEDDTATCAVPS